MWDWNDGYILINCYPNLEKYLQDGYLSFDGWISLSSYHPIYSSNCYSSEDKMPEGLICWRQLSKWGSKEIRWYRCGCACNDYCVCLDSVSRHHISGPLYKYGLTLILARLITHIYYEMWDEITYPFPNFNPSTVEAWERISNFISHFTRHVITYPFWD